MLRAGDASQVEHRSNDCQSDGIRCEKGESWTPPKEWSKAMAGNGPVTACCGLGKLPADRTRVRNVLEELGTIAAELTGRTVLEHM